MLFCSSGKKLEVPLLSGLLPLPPTMAVPLPLAAPVAVIVPPRAMGPDQRSAASSTILIELAGDCPWRLPCSMSTQAKLLHLRVGERRHVVFETHRRRKRVTEREREKEKDRKKELRKEREATTNARESKKKSRRGTDK